MPSRVLESAPRVDEASASLRPANPRRWTSIELGHQPIIATPRKRLSTTTPPLTRAGSYFLPQPGASGIEARSPANKRAPASRSSHGIETANGPPPALSTQRSPQSYSTEDSWRYPASTDQLALRPQLTHRALQGLAAAGTTSRTNSSNSTIRLADVSFDRGTNLEASENTSYTQRDIRTERSDMSATTPWLNGQHSSEPDPDRTIRISDSTTVAGRGEEGKATREGAKARQLQEDLFLDLAHTDVSMQDVTDPAVRVDRRRVSESPESARYPYYVCLIECTFLYPALVIVCQQSAQEKVPICNPEPQCIWEHWISVLARLTAPFCCSLAYLPPIIASQCHMLINSHPLYLHGLHRTIELLPVMKGPTWPMVDLRSGINLGSLSTRIYPPRAASSHQEIAPTLLLRIRLTTGRGPA